MADIGVVATDERMRELSKRLDNVYTEAYNTAIENNQKAINNLAKLKDEIYTASKYSHLTQDQKDKKLEAFAREITRTEKVAENIAQELNRAGEIATDIIQGEMYGIYGLNYDFTTYSVSRQAGVAFNFTQYDRNQLAVLSQKGQSPFTKIAYNNMGSNPNIVRKLQAAFVVGTINGESKRELTRHVQAITGQKKWQAKRVAQTERTRVQTEARMLGIREAEEMGIPMQKQWVARIINTRESHLNVNGEIQEANDRFSNGLACPGDPSGPP